MARRKRSYLEQQFRSARKAMRPDKVAARFISGGKHQSFQSIAKSPFKTKTVHTPKSGKRAYQQRMKRERAALAKVRARERREVAEYQKLMRKDARSNRPSQEFTRPDPAAVKRITLRQAEAEARRADRRAQRLADCAYDSMMADEPARTPRKPAAPVPELTPLQAAVKEVTGRQARQVRAAGKSTRKPKRPLAGQPATPDGIRPLLRSTRGLAQKPAARPKPKRHQPTKKATPKKKTAKAPGKTVGGMVMAATCPCQGTGHIPVLDAAGNPHGSESCPYHGRAGASRGQGRLTSKAAMRDSGLPGLGAWLVKRQPKRRGNSDKRWAKAVKHARQDPRRAGPTLVCDQCTDGIVNRELTDRLRAQYIDAALAAASAADDKAPSRRRLEAQARRLYPYDLCSTCRGLGVVETSTRETADGRNPVAEWRPNAGLHEGHRLTARERATGKRKTENARRVDQRRLLP